MQIIQCIQIKSLIERLMRLKIESIYNIAFKETIVKGSWPDLPTIAQGLC